MVRGQIEVAGQVRRERDALKCAMTAQIEATRQAVAKGSAAVARGRDGDRSRGTP